jgi:hypothetical protein
MFPFFGSALSEYNPAFELYNYFVHCQMFWGVTEFSISLVECVKDCLYFPWSVIFLALAWLWSVFAGHGRKSEHTSHAVRMCV